MILIHPLSDNWVISLPNQNKSSQLPLCVSVNIIHQIYEPVIQIMTKIAFLVLTYKVSQNSQTYFANDDV